VWRVSISSHLDIEVAVNAGRGVILEWLFGDLVSSSSFEHIVSTSPTTVSASSLCQWWDAIWFLESGVLSLLLVVLMSGVGLAL
jgi:hypothetical protein